MTIDIGTTLGVFEITGHLGAGGMGEVYRATDTKLERDVAIKVLPDVFAKDSDRLGRFQREARLLAALNHPNIATIHDYAHDETSGVHYLVMEVIEGDTLGDRIDRGPIPVEQALPIFAQIAEALETAHEQGIIHRDLKPGNIKVSDDGTVKVLDFGLGKAMEPPSEPVSGDAPTRATAPDSTKMSQEGIILGTPVYMSPEQAQGKPVDKRTDIWAFGCCLYESLTSSLPFQGETVSATLAKVLETKPDWDALPSDIPPRIRDLLERCLEKDPRMRLRDIGDAWAELRKLQTESGRMSAVAAAAAPPASRVKDVAMWSAILGLAALVAWFGLVRTPQESALPSSTVAEEHSPDAAPEPVRRFLIDREDSIHPIADLLGSLVLDLLDSHIFESYVALSPDGSQLVYLGDLGDKTSLILRSLDRIGTQILPETQYARMPFFSPDGQWVGYFRFREGLDTTLMKIEIDSGRTVEICEVHGSPLGASWGDDGKIVFASSSSGLRRVAESGGAPEEITTLGGETGMIWHGLPHLLPEGRGILFTTKEGREGSDLTIILISKDGGEGTVLVESAYRPLYSPLGYLTYIQDSRWFAAAFDPAQPNRLGLPHDITEAGMQLESTDTLGIAISEEGSLAFVRSTATGGQKLQLVWVDFEGNIEALDFEPADYWNARVSPDGKRIATDLQGPNVTRGVWILDLQRSTRRPLATSGLNGQPNWMPNGLSLIYYTVYDLDGGVTLIPAMRAVDFRSEHELISVGKAGNYYPHSVSSDGKWLAVAYGDAVAASIDVGILSLGGDQPIRPIANTDFWEDFPTFSPDGNWISYSSNESGQMEIYVVPFSEERGSTLVSTDGGQKSVWSPDGKTLYYQKGRAMMAVDIETKPEFKAGIPRTLFEGDFYSLRGRDYDLSPEGDRFLMLIRSDTQSGLASSRSLVFVENWGEELKRLAPVPERK